MTGVRPSSHAAAGWLLSIAPPMTSDDAPSLAASLFAQESGRTVFLGRYDTGEVSFTNAAWRLRGEWSAWPHLTLKEPDPSDLQLPIPTGGSKRSPRPGCS